MTKYKVTLVQTFTSDVIIEETYPDRAIQKAKALFPKWEAVYVEEALPEEIQSVADG